MVDAAAAVDTAALGAEVGLVVSRVRSRRELEALDLPVLDRAASSVGLSRDAMLAESIPLVPDDAYRRFLELLLPFPLPAQGRWPALGRRHVSDDDTGRGVGAGYAVFGISSWDGLNARTDELGGRSRREIAEEMLAAAVTRREAKGAAGSQVGAEAKGRRWGLAAAGVFTTIAIGVLGVVGVMAADSSSEESSSKESSSEDPADVESTIEVRCQPVAEVGSVSAPWTPATAAAAIEEAAAAASTELAAVCPVGSANSWGELVVQEVDDPDMPVPGALIGVPGGPSVYLPPAVYAGYRQIGAKDGSSSQASAGFPVGFTQLPDGHVEAVFTKGVILVGESIEAPFFWIGAPFVEWWRAHSELGLPTSNPMADLTQHFQQGQARLDLSPLGGTPVAEVISAREDALPEQRAERILRQADATAWWVDADGARHWIPDGETWECLGGDAVVAGNAVPGWAISALPTGGLAVCP